MTNEREQMFAFASEPSISERIEKEVQVPTLFKSDNCSPLFISVAVEWSMVNDKWSMIMIF